MDFTQYNVCQANVAAQTKKIIRRTKVGRGSISKALRRPNSLETTIDSVPDECNYFIPLTVDLKKHKL